MKSRDRRAERMSEFVTNMFQYDVTVGITRSEVILGETNNIDGGSMVGFKAVCRPKDIVENDQDALCIDKLTKREI